MPEVKKSMKIVGPYLECILSADFGYHAIGIEFCYVSDRLQSLVCVANLENCVISPWAIGKNVGIHEWGVRLPAPCRFDRPEKGIGRYYANKESLSEAFDWFAKALKVAATDPDIPTNMKIGGSQVAEVYSAPAPPTLANGSVTCRRVSTAGRPVCPYDEKVVTGLHRVTGMAELIGILGFNKKEEIVLFKSVPIENTLEDVTKGKLVLSCPGYGPENVKAAVPAGKDEIILIVERGEEKDSKSYALATGCAVKDITLTVDKGVLTLKVAYDFSKVVTASAQ